MYSWMSVCSWLLMRTKRWPVHFAYKNETTIQNEKYNQTRGGGGGGESKDKKVESACIAYERTRYSTMLVLPLLVGPWSRTGNLVATTDRSTPRMLSLTEGTRM